MSFLVTGSHLTDKSVWILNFKEVEHDRFPAGIQAFRHV